MAQGDLAQGRPATTERPALDTPTVIVDLTSRSGTTMATFARDSIL